MNYLDIIINGYFDENNQKYLDRYFYREFINAQKGYFEADEFFNGCLNVLKKWENHLFDKVCKRCEELYLLMTAAEEGTLKFSDENNEGKSYEQRAKETIDYCKKELNDQRMDGIGDITFTIHLASLTNGRVLYNMWYKELLHIKLSLQEAYLKIQEEKKRIQPQSNKNTENLKEDVLPKDLRDIFLNPKDLEICLDILRQLDIKVIDSENYYIGKKKKGIFPIWINALEINKPKLIHNYSYMVYRYLLNKEIKGLNLSKDASEFRKYYPSLDKYNIDIQTLLSQYSQNGKLGK